MFQIKSIMYIALFIWILVKFGLFKFDHELAAMGESKYQHYNNY